MNISIIAFTQRGADKAQQLKNVLSEDNCELYAKPERANLIGVTQSLSEWCKQQFQMKDAIIFVGATGIAVRGIADAMKDKLEDPAVLVIDELGRFVIPLLSGHVGGANALATHVAELLQAIPVITTATDLSGVFAIDTFATKNHLVLDKGRRVAYKEISAVLLAGEEIGIWIDSAISYEGILPKQLHVLNNSEWEKCLNEKPAYRYVIAITDTYIPDKEWIVPLVPRCHVLGIGCKKNTPVEKLHDALHTFLQQEHISDKSIRALASIDLKQWEVAILSLAEKLEIPFHIYSADVLNEIEGEFTSSEFVKKTTGVDCVCERSALAGLFESQDKGELFVRKTSFDGITFALAGRMEDRRIRFE